MNHSNPSPVSTAASSQEDALADDRVGSDAFQVQSRVSGVDADGMARADLLKREPLPLAPDLSLVPEMSAAEAYRFTNEACEVAARFEHIYQTASGDPTCVPWYHHRGANQALIEWLNSEAHCLVRPGARSVVVGCGLGDDVIELADRGYDAMGFDISPTCVEWARRRFPVEAERFVHADILAIPSRMRARFDLVVEAFTIQAVSPSLRLKTIEGVASLVKPHGVILILARSRDDAMPLSECECAPYPVCRTELVNSMEELGFAPAHGIVSCLDDDNPPRQCVRAAFRRLG